MTRDDVLDVLQELGAVTPEGGHQAGGLRSMASCILIAFGAVLPGKVSRSEVPVRFFRHRIAVSLPKSAYTQSKRTHLEGRFQSIMARRQASAYLDFASDWQGLDTPLKHGIT